MFLEQLQNSSRASSRARSITRSKDFHFIRVCGIFGYSI